MLGNSYSTDGKRWHRRLPGITAAQIQAILGWLCLGFGVRVVGLGIRPSITITGRGFVNHGSGLGVWVLEFV